MENKGRCRSHKTRAFSKMKNMFIVSLSKSIKRKNKTNENSSPFLVVRICLEWVGCEYLLEVGGLREALPGSQLLLCSWSGKPAQYLLSTSTHIRKQTSKQTSK